MNNHIRSHKSESKKKLICIAVILALLPTCAYLARHPILRTVGNFLIVNDTLKKSDVIVVLEGSRDRMEEAVRLVKVGSAENIVVSGSRPSSRGEIERNMRHEAGRLGITLPDIIWEEKSRHTFEHPIYVKPILKERGFHSAIVLSSPYHMRRAAMLFDRTFRGEDIELTYRYVRESGFDPDQWWKDPGMRKLVGLEYLKLGVNFWGRGFSAFVVEHLCKVDNNQ